MENSLLLPKAVWWNDAECNMFYLFCEQFTKINALQIFVQNVKQLSNTVRCGVTEVCEQQVMTYMWCIYTALYHVYITY